MQSGNDNSTRPGNGRYVFGPGLGQGGVAAVFRVHDQVLGRDVALKLLRADKHLSTRKSTIELFAREYHTLSQLEHPNVVTAYDYGVSAGEPFYTMELLDGGDLIDRAPVPWRDACAIGRDICSALSVIHSRRMIYRDISPRNIRCTSDGTAKLIDFGAMSAMGPTKQFVGTLPMAAPEAVHLQPLDARSDLYSLGATLYYALVGVSPYPARTATQLTEAWQTPITLPSAFIAEIPEALDALILELLEFEPAKRPASAAEVMARLSAVAGLPTIELQLVSRAYLTTPTLVGRGSALQHVEIALREASQRRGRALFIQGQAGSGRSRFLDAAVLAAKLAGAIVVRADASDSDGLDYGVARTLTRQLLEFAPKAALKSALAVGDILGYVAPALAERAQQFAGPFDPVQLQLRLQPALRDWFLAVADYRPLVVAVDDLHRIDAPSAGLLALLARAASDHPVLVVTSADYAQHGESSALNLIVEASRTIRIHKLGPSDTESMLRSVFGDVPHIPHVAHRIHALSKGRPREIMLLAQHMVDCGLARYHAGSWSLPDSLDESSLPLDMVEAVRVRVRSLSPAAARLAEAFALAPNTRYEFEECELLSGGLSSRDVLSALNELQAAQIVVDLRGLFALGRDSDHAAILDARDGAEHAQLHGLLADVFERRNDHDLQAAAHRLAAGQDRRALELLVHQAEQSIKVTDASVAAYAKLLQALPSNWLQLYERGIALAQQYDCPSAYALTLRTRIAGIAAVSKIDASHVFAELFAQLSLDSGLDDYAALAHEPAATRLSMALGRAGQRFANTPEERRGLEPGKAIPLLGRMVVAGVGSAGITLNASLCRYFPSLAPLVPLSPALSIAAQMAEGGSARVRGSSVRAHAVYNAIVCRLDQDSAGLDPTYQRTICLSLSYVLGTVEANMGLASSLERAQRIEASPLHEVSAMLLRMLYHVWQGDNRAADKCREQVELLKVERMSPQGVDGAHLTRELSAYASADDLTRVKQTLDSIQIMAAKISAWRPILHWANCEYERIRGDFGAALSEVEHALSAISEDGHLVWADAAGAHLKILLALGRVAEACERGAEYLSVAQQRDVGHSANAIRMPLAIACARMDRAHDAIELTQAVIDYYVNIGSTGLNLCLAHEARAKVAIIFKDSATFQTHAKLCRASIPEGASGTLNAKYERLLRAARGLDGVFPAVPQPLERGLGTTLTGTQVSAILDATANRATLAKRGLELLLDACGARQGHLLILNGRELALAASIAEEALPPNIYALACERFENEHADESMTTGSGDGESDQSAMWTAQNTLVYRPLLLAYQGRHGYTMAGMAVVLYESDAVFRPPTLIAAELARKLAPEETDRVRREEPSLL
jgi:Protein kinase domain/AAA ATPase domain